MRIAVALFGDEVSPRWCGAREALVASVRGGAIEATERLELGDCSNVVRLGRLRVLGVSVLLCGGFDRRFLLRAGRLGIRVVWGVTGGALKALQRFAGASAADVSSRSGECRTTAPKPSPKEKRE